LTSPLFLATLKRNTDPLIPKHMNEKLWFTPYLRLNQERERDLHREHFGQIAAKDQRKRELAIEIVKLSEDDIFNSFYDDFSIFVLRENGLYHEEIFPSGTFPDTKEKQYLIDIPLKRSSHGWIEPQPDRNSVFVLRVNTKHCFIHLWQISITCQHGYIFLRNQKILSETAYQTEQGYLPLHGISYYGSIRDFLLDRESVKNAPIKRKRYIPRFLPRGCDGRYGVIVWWNDAAGIGCAQLKDRRVWISYEEVESKDTFVRLEAGTIITYQEKMHRKTPPTLGFNPLNCCLKQVRPVSSPGPVILPPKKLVRESFVEQQNETKD
jgi:hypothetical protein